MTALHGRPLNLQTMVFSLPWRLTVVSPPRDCNPTSQGIDPCLFAVQKTKLLSAIYRSSAGNLSNETIGERQLILPHAHKYFGREDSSGNEVSAADGRCGGVSECIFPDPFKYP